MWIQQKTKSRCGVPQSVTCSDGASGMSQSMSDFLVEIGVASLDCHARDSKTNEGIKTMKSPETSTSAVTSDIDAGAAVSEFRNAVGANLERLCVMAGTSSPRKMTGEDAAQLAVQRYEQAPDEPACRRGAWPSVKAERSRGVSRSCGTGQRAANCSCLAKRRPAMPAFPNSLRRLRGEANRGSVGVLAAVDVDGLTGDEVAIG